MKKVVKKIPELRFPEFDGDWVEKESKKLFSNSRKKGNHSLAIFSVTQNRGLVPRNSLDRKMGGDARADKNLYVGSKYLTYNMMRMWQGAIGLAEQECMVSPAYIVLKPAKDTCSEFFINFFQRSRSLYLFWAYSYGLTNDRLRLYYKDFSAIVFLTPTLQEQQKIASFLAAVDKKIGQLTLKKELLEQYKKGVMQKIFSQEIRFKDENGQDYPDWETSELGKHLQVKTGNKDTKDKKEGGLYRFFVRSNTVERIDSYGYEGEAILTSGDGVGVGKNYHYVNEKFDFHQRVYCLHDFENEVLGRYVFYYFSTHFYQRAIRLSAKNSVDSVRRDMIVKMPFPYPVLPEQQKIAKFLTSIDNKINYVQTQLTQTQNFKKGLLQKMFV